MTPNHSRSASEESNGPSMAYILEHVLQYPGSYDFPLKTMYELNRMDRTPPKDFARSVANTSKSVNASPVSGQFSWTPSETAAMTFQAYLMNQLKSLPTRNSSLPPTFINNFVLKVLHPNVEQCDWIQALTALDYLKDLETRRRKETVAAFERLHIHQDTWDTDMAYMAEKFPGIALWINNIEGKNKKAEQYYGCIWLNIRRWIMINELSENFNKLNCLSMLNTLLPPVHEKTKLPSNFLTHQTLRDERQSLFEMINRVQKQGPAAVLPLIEKNKGPNEATGWPSVQKTLDKYLRVALNMINDCQATTGPESFDRYGDVYGGKEKKHDSGVSFGSDRRPSVASSVHDKHSTDSTSNYPPSPKGLSKMERITREFRRMRVKPRPEIDEIVHVAPRAPADELPILSSKKSLKKARSLASLKFGNGSSLSIASRKGSDAVPFDAEQMKKQRQMYEASLSKNNA